MVQELDQRYNALLQMYGEKVEEAEELRLDLQDVKEMYKTQVCHHLLLTHYSHSPSSAFLLESVHIQLLRLFPSVLRKGPKTGGKLPPIISA